MKIEFIPTTTAIQAYLFIFFRSMSQYKRASSNNTQPSEAKVNELVAIRLIMGVIFVQSRPKPIASAITPARARYFTFCAGVFSDTSSLPARQPHIVWAAVGIKLMVTQPSGLILLLKTRSM